MKTADTSHKSLSGVLSLTFTLCIIVQQLHTLNQVL